MKYLGSSLEGNFECHHLSYLDIINESVFNIYYRSRTPRFNMLEFSLESLNQ